jgi:hypothetical protein
MKYKYRLVENEEPTTPDSGGEENGLRRMDIPKELKLTTHGNVTADDIIRILEDPKYFSDAFIFKPDDLKDFERKVFGDKPTSDKFINTNKTIYDENGIKLYNEIENSVKDRFERKDFIIKKDKSNKTIFAFPIKNKKHQDLVVAYLNVKPKTYIKPKKIVNPKTNEVYLTFNTSDKKDIEKILKAAEKAVDPKTNQKAISSKDYSLETIDKEDENKLRESIKEIIFKKLNVNESLLSSEIKQAIAKVDPNMSYVDFAVAVANVIKDDYGNDNIEPFMKVLHKELGLNDESKLKKEITK